MSARPKPSETEEDLLRYQEEFLRSKAAPAATVVRKADKRGSGKDVGASSTTGSAADRDVVSFGDLPKQFEHTSTAPPVKKSRFKEQQGKDQRKASQVEEDPEIMLEKHDRHISKVLLDIVERDTQDMPVYYPNASAMQGFPTAMHREQGSITSTAGSDGEKKRSIFAQQFAMKSMKDFGVNYKPRKTVEQMQEESMEVAGETPKPMDVDQGAFGFGHTSKLVSGDGLSSSSGQQEATKIHEENVATLARMKEEEILAERQKLMQMLDPSLINFLKSRQKKSGSKTESKEVPAPEKSEKISPTKPGSDDSRPPAVKIQNEEAGDMSDLPIKPDKKWVGMDEVEPEKLEWMKDLPPPTADDSKTGKPVRFDFHGNMINDDKNIPAHLGLHHHGSEPERAGYTLEELFQLARSSNMQQRVMAITTMARVITNARRGDFHEIASTPIIPAVLEGGLVFILRWALDDTTENSMAAAVRGLSDLLVCTNDELGADRVQAWHHGAAIPSLTPEPQEFDDENEDEEADRKAKETDADVLKQDVIKGLLRMQILPRLRYILEVWRPAASVVVHILEILVRIARHSAESAYQILKCPRLIDTIHKEFLPTAWTPADAEKPLSMTHGYPVTQALKLIRVICTAGRNMAASMVSKYEIIHRIGRYLAEDPRDMQLNLCEAYNLQVESLYTWRTLTAYGLASSSFIELYPVITRSLQRFSLLTSSSPAQDMKYGCAAVCLLEEVVFLASSAAQAHPSQNRSADIREMDGQKSHDSDPVPALNWSHVTGLLQPIERQVERSLREISELHVSQLAQYDMTFASCCLNFVASYCSKISSQPGYDAVEALEHIEQMCAHVLLPCLQSTIFMYILKSARVTYQFEVIKDSLTSITDAILNHLEGIITVLVHLEHLTRDHSVVLSERSSKRGEEPKNLPELGSLIGNEGDTCPVLNQASTLSFVSALARLLLALGRIHKDIPQKYYHYLLRDEEVLLYIRRSCQVKHYRITSNYFARFENLLHYYLISMSRLAVGSCDTELYHQCAMFLLRRLHVGDEHIAHDLLSTVVFNRDLIGSLHVPEEVIKQLDLSGRTPLPMATQEVVTVTPEELSTDILDNLPSIRGTYLTACSGLMQQVEASRSRMLHLGQKVSSFLLGRCKLTLVPVDWVYLPILELYNSSSQRKHGDEERVAPAVIATVTNTLRFIYMLESWRPAVLYNVSFATKYTRLMCTFLAGSDLFLERWVHSYLSAIFKLYCRPVFLDRMDFNKSVPGVLSFYDMFVLFLNQYASVSFGDSLFGLYVMMVVQQCHNVRLRTALWGEHAAALRSLMIPVSQMLIPVSRFLEPEEKDVELIRLYAQALFRGVVTRQRNPLLYLIAIHHVNRFCYTHSAKHQQLRLAILKEASLSKNETLHQHLLYYKKENPDCDNAMELYEELPRNRQETLKSVQS